MKNLQQLICKLSQLVGILPFYHNYKGEKIEISNDTKAKLISAMGFSLEEESLSYWIDYFENYPWKNFLEPVYIINQRFLASIYLKENHKCDISIEIFPFKDLGTEGETLNLSFVFDTLHKAERRIFSEEVYFKYNIPLPPLNIGYYKLKVFSSDLQSESLLIVTPNECFTPFEYKTWGVHCNIWSLKDENKEGDFTNLKEITKFVSSLGGFVSINPLHLNDPEDFYGISPYSAVSRQFKTPLYISVCPTKEENEIFFNYSSVWQKKIKALKEEFKKFYINEYLKGTDRAKAFINYKNGLCPAIKKDLECFAVFCFLREKYGKNWQQWNEKFRKPNNEILNRVYLENEREVLFYEYLQWLVNEDIENLKPYNICSDMGFGSLKSSFDVWFNQDLYALSAEYGAPPDDFNPKGQKWGFPPVIPFKLKKYRYLPFIKILRSNMNTSLLRIDHALGLFRAFWIPEGSTSYEGAYIRYPWNDLISIIALESHLNRTGVIGEDLGTAEKWMKEELIKRKICSWKVFYFEKNTEGFKSSNLYPTLALCSITTHDLPTLKGFWEGKDIEFRRKFSIFDESQAKEAFKERQKDKERIINLLNTEQLMISHSPQFTYSFYEELLLGIIKFLARTPSRYLLLYLEDLLIMEEQTNFPGTTTEYPNWQRKLPLTVNEIINLPILKKILAILKESSRIRLSA